MAQIETDVVVREVRIDASPETVFPFFTDPSLMTRWMGKSATLDPPARRCPGHQRQHARCPRRVPRGHASRRVVFTWGWDGQEHAPSPGSSTVEIDLAGELRRDPRPPDPSWAQRRGSDPARPRWTHYLERLQIAGSGGDPGPDAWVDAS